jgi:hypothetical protein
MLVKSIYKKFILAFLISISIPIGLYVIGVRFATNKAQIFASKYDASINIGFIYPSWSGIVFKNVQVNACHSSVKANFDKIIVKVRGLNPEAIDIQSGDITALGTIQDLKSCKKSGSGISKSTLEISGKNINIHWIDKSRDLSIDKVAFNKLNEIGFTADKIKMVDPRFDVIADGINVNLDINVNKLVFRLSNNSKPQLDNLIQSDSSITVSKLEDVYNDILKILGNFDFRVKELELMSDRTSVSLMQFKLRKMDNDKLYSSFKYQGKKFSEFINLENSDVYLTVKLKNNIFNGFFDIKSIEFDHKILSDQPIKLPLTLNMDFYVSEDLSNFDVKYLSVKSGPIELAYIGTVKKSKLSKVIDGNIILSHISCSNLFSSLPDNVAGIMAGSNVSGVVLALLAIKYDFEAPEKSNSKLYLQNTCKFLDVPETLNISKFRKPFKHRIYTSTNELKEITVGPTTRNWVPSGFVSPFVEFALLIREDPGFRSHRGILIEALDNSIRDNLKTGQFLRGGSTITMQLVRNLWLNRKKNLVRKFQEIMLATYLEQYMSKEEILELYLNVIEYGPDIYGIGPASEYYFKTKPEFLTLSQSVFLVSILSNPKKPRFTSNGPLHPGHLSTIRLLMRMMYERKFLNEEQFRQGLREVPVFGKSDVLMSQ